MINRTPPFLARLIFAGKIALSALTFMDVQATQAAPADHIAVQHPREALATDTTGCVTLFLAGTIDNGNSKDWQQTVAERLADSVYMQTAQQTMPHILVFNPRRSIWHPGDSQELEYQIRWELSHLEEADYILMYIAGNSKSPISLLEMGLHIRGQKMLVVCEESYYRYDNVRVTCGFYGVPLYTDLDTALAQLKKLLTLG